MAGDGAGFVGHARSRKCALSPGEGQGEGVSPADVALDARHSATRVAFVPSPVATGEGQGEGPPLSHLSPGQPLGRFDSAAQTRPDIWLALAYVGVILAGAALRVVELHRYPPGLFCWPIFCRHYASNSPSHSS